MRTLLFVISLAFSGSTIAESSVWKVASKNSYMYLAGTMHVLSKDDYPLPVEFDTAYSDSSHIVFETNLDVLHSFETSNRMLEHLTYSDGSTLLDRLSEDTTALLKQYSGNFGIPVENIQLFKPALVSSLFTGMELETLGVNAPGVDAHYFAKASADKKTQGELESIQTQISLLGEMGEQNPDLFVKYMLDDMPQLNELMQQLRDSWRSGDLEAIDEVMIESTRLSPGLYSKLLTERNNKWMPKLRCMLQSSRTEMVLVGAAHLGGKHGLLQSLEKAGYEVTRL